MHFVWLPREAHRGAAFLTAQEIADATPKRVIPRAVIARTHFEQAPLHLILHSGLTGSTLLTHALDRKGTAMTLSEPPILTNVVSCPPSGAPAERVNQVLRDVIRLLFPVPSLRVKP